MAKIHLLMSDATSGDQQRGQHIRIAATQPESMPKSRGISVRRSFGRLYAFVSKLISSLP
jgi:hypothetical protein